MLSLETLPPTARAQIVEVIRDPVKFSRGILGIDPWSRAREILGAVARPKARLAVKACHSSAKTWTAATAALWFLTRYGPNAIVITTAPTWIQVEKLLWGYIRRLVAQAKIAYPDPNKTSLEIGPNNYALGLSTDEGVRFQGFHADHLLFILDEAPGVRPDVWEAIEGARAGDDVRVLAIGNPVIASGPFYDCFDRQRGAWTTMTISAFDTPNLRGTATLPPLTLEDIQAITDRDDPRLAGDVRPYLATRQWVWEKWHEWGKHGHPSWEGRVTGGFPPQAPDALLALTWIEQARTRAPLVGSGRLRAGIDVAGPGEDETTLWLVNGPTIVASHFWPTSDPRGEIVQVLAPHREHLEAVNVDSAGIGHYLALHLADHGFPVNHVNVGEAALDGERFRNLKAELYWGLRMRFAEGDVAGPLDDETVTQLAGIRWRTNARGQTEIESKDDARKRGVKSPDRAEGLMLAYARPGGTGVLEWMRDEARSRDDRARATAAEEGTVA